MEAGYLYGGNLMGSFQWTNKEPSLWNAINPSGESIGDCSHITFTALKGAKCPSCRVLLLHF